jgi:hypothetical protein
VEHSSEYSSESGVGAPQLATTAGSNATSEQTEETVELETDVMPSSSAAESETDSAKIPLSAVACQETVESESASMSNPAATESEDDGTKSSAEAVDNEDCCASDSTPAPVALSEYLPESPPRHSDASEEATKQGALLGKAATPEGRAASRKQQVLAKVAEEHESIRKQHFVFGKSGVTPMRSTKAKVGSKSPSDTGDGNVKADA